MACRAPLSRSVFLVVKPAPADVERVVRVLTVRSGLLGTTYLGAWAAPSATVTSKGRTAWRMAPVMTPPMGARSDRARLADCRHALTPLPAAGNRIPPPDATAEPACKTGPDCRVSRWNALCNR